MSKPPAERVPIEPGYFTIPSDPAAPPQLLGSRCASCGEHFFPRRPVCAKCCHRVTEDVALSSSGTLYTYTYLFVPLFNSKRASDGGYGVGQIDLPEGPRVQSVLQGGPDDFRIGMTMEMELETLRENEEGQEVVIFRFRPGVAEGAGATS